MTPSFEEYVASLGFDPAALDETQTANLKLQYAAEYPEGGDAGAEPVVDAADEPAPDEEMAAAEDETPVEEEAPTNAKAKAPRVKAKADPRAVKAERDRAATITRLCAEAGNPTVRVRGEEKPVALAGHAIVANWKVDQVKEHILQQKRAARPTGPAIVSRSHERDCTVQALQGAMILRAGGRLDSPHYATQRALFLNIPSFLRRPLNDAERNRVMEASHRYSDLSAVDLCRECLRIEGRQVPHSRSETIQAAFSGSALTNVFTTNVNAILLDSYMEAEDTTMGWVTEEDVADYQTQERPRVLIGEGLTELPEAGTAEHASWSDTAESYKVHRFARQFQIDEIAIINDRLDAISDVPRRFGEATAWLRPDLVYAEIMSNPTLSQDSLALFSASHSSSNLLTTAALTAATLKAAIAAQYLFQENGRNLNLRTTHLIVPPTLKWTALELLNSAQIVIAGTAGSVTERGDMNAIQQENLTLVVDSRLENGVTHPLSKATQAGSASTWYVASTLAHTLVVGYLRGTGRAPRVRSTQLDKGQFGINFDVQLTIGVKALDWRGFVKNTA